MRTPTPGSAAGATREPPPVQTPAPAAKPQPKTKGLAKVSFGAIAAKKEETKTAYPVFPDANGECALIAARLIANTDAFDALESSLKVDKAELKLRVEPHYFAVNQRKHEVPSSVAVNSPAGEVLVTFQNRYASLPDEAGLLPVLGEERVGTYFRQAFEIKINGDKLESARCPEEPADLDVADDRNPIQELIDALQALFQRYGVLDALERKVGIKPTKEFHAARHLELTPAENLALEQACPIIAMIKTKGRK